MNKSDSGFLKFLSENNIIATIIATMISQRITELSSSFIDSLVVPILNRDADGNGEADIEEIKNYKLNIFGINFKIGEFAIDIMKFLIILFIAYQINKAVNKFNEK